MIHTREIRHFHLFCGLGAGARGFNRAQARVGNLQGVFRCLGGIDVDPVAIENFGRLTGTPGTVLDLFDREQFTAFHGREPGQGWAEASPADIRRAAGNERPHIVFLSAPCKGFSGLLSETKSKTGKYQAPNWGPGAPRRRTSESNWRKPLQWHANAAEFMAKHGRRQRVFCASLADVFDNQVPDQWRRDLFQLIAATPDLDWLLLTKRIGNAHRMLPPDWVAAPPGREIPRMPDNVWIGATITSQEEADRDIPKLLAVPARVRFLSMEPLLGPVDLPQAKAFGLHGFGTHIMGVDWVIVGGESGPGARPMHPDWARSLRDQCAAAGVPFLFKQHGEWAPGSGDFGGGRFETAAIERTGQIVVPGGFTTTAYPKGASSQDGWAMVHRCGKKAAGRLLDGVEHNGFPGGRA